MIKRINRLSYICNKGVKSCNITKLVNATFSNISAKNGKRDHGYTFGIKSDIRQFPDTFFK